MLQTDLHFLALHHGGQNCGHRNYVSVNLRAQFRLQKIAFRTQKWDSFAEDGWKLSVTIDSIISSHIARVSVNWRGIFAASIDEVI